ncbi:MAG: cyclic nucleotide-binding protein [Chloroflexi bacterium]|nr:cyclic nucleotide-binding protein [Chloroflexota bacterium]MDB5074213.1 cyclic nucleotide-binding protein [Chloroflexota bacterium]
MTTEQLLASVSLFNKLDKRDIRSLARLVKEQHYSPGQPIVLEGQTGLGLYIISDGTAEVVRGSRVIAQLGVGDFFGEIALLDDLPRTADVRAVTETTCLTLAKWEFLGELEAHPQMALPLLPMLSLRIREADARADRLQEELG